MPVVCGYAITVICEGKPLEQLDVRNDVQLSTASCWIKAEDGKAFIINVFRSSAVAPGRDWSVYINIDGVFSTGVSARRTDVNCQVRHKHAKGSSGEVGRFPYIFQPRGPELYSGRLSSARPGSIQVEIIEGNRSTVGVKHAITDSLDYLSGLHANEEMNKGVDMGFGFDLKAEKRRSPVSLRFPLQNRRTVATCTFFYRSQIMLEALQVTRPRARQQTIAFPTSARKRVAEDDHEASSFATTINVKRERLSQTNFDVKNGWP